VSAPWWIAEARQGVGIGRAEASLGMLMRRVVQTGARASKTSKTSRAATCDLVDVRLTFTPALVAALLGRIDSWPALTDR
jgi:hypothetical protein